MFLWILFVCVLVVGTKTENDSTTEPANTTLSTLSTNPTDTTNVPLIENPEVPSEVLTLVNPPPTHPQVRVIDGLKGLAHGVSSGKIIVIGNDTFQVPNFHFDGTAPRAFFLVGKGDTVTESGTILYHDDSKSPLPAFTGQSVKLTLPGSLTVDDIDWLAIWCFAYSLNLGYVFVNKGVFLNSPQTLDLRDNVTSGPIILVNKKTLYVPNFRYNGGHKNVHFWVGNGSQPSSDGTMIPDETGSLEDLHVYQGENLNLRLPGDVNTDNIEYFGVWSIDEGVSLGYVPINNVKDVPEEILLLLPKCCPQNSVLSTEGCTEKPSVPQFRPTFKVYEHNETHFCNDSLDLEKITFFPYVSAPQCQIGKYALDEKIDKFAILQNTSLLLKGAEIVGILSTDAYCLEYIEDETEMNIFVCLREYKIQKAMFITYVTFTIISTFCFATTFVLYYFWLKVEDVHRKCFTGYVFAMTMTFLALTIVQTASVEDSGCKVLGFLFQISMIASFTLLGILCVDVFIIIKYIDEKKFLRLRKQCYVGVALGVPIFFMIISLARNLIPDVPNSFFKPQYIRNKCYFDDEDQRTIIFYIPICLCMAVSAFCLSWTKFIIVQNDRDKKNDYFWMEKGMVYKFMWRKHLIIVLTSLMWSLETIVHLFFADSGMLVAIDIVEASQGILVLLLFVVNRETRTQIVKAFKAKRKKKTLIAIPDEDFIRLADFNKS